MSWADKLTDITIFGSILSLILAKSLHNLSNTHFVIICTLPLCSAIGINSAGDTMPNVSFVHLSKAS
jgi:hypothetical protein